MLGVIFGMAILVTGVYSLFFMSPFSSYILFFIALVYFILAIKIVRPTHRAVIEQLGKYKRFMSSGITFVVPFVQRIYKVNTTEMMKDVDTQEVITKDNLNAMVDLQVYFKVKTDEQSIKNSQYNVYSYMEQIVALARTTMRNVIGNNEFVKVNSQRNVLNETLRKTMQDEVKNWGIDIVRCELKEIRPPSDVQDTMNKVLKAQNEKVAAVDFATARETEADGVKRAEIKKAEGVRQGRILEAEGQARAIQLVNEAAKKYFVGNAKELKKLEVTENSLKNNSKIIITKSGAAPMLLLSDKDLTK